ncbi:ATP-dependent Clp protease, protease subunit [Solimonas aquatica]|uniref:ATP-dependent Clp protease proteolytic subunit n=1 Tax=Solimonas aquatica TaxID=489703 RepID=A0A1H9J3L6_9GAMM|nr:ATP-dependent Clp protease proteolytic subunit [Solimonas aquatica]SEQ81423.1 ATP-dependent Clp protease, protease subunit [Solimonas aquatica]
MFEHDLPLAAKEKDKEKDEAKSAKNPALEERLFKARTVLIYGAINQKLAETFSARLLALSAESDDPITIYINSQGGHVESGDTIHDMIKFVKPTVRIIGTGWVASAGALIYTAAKPENRLSLPNTRYMLHQPSGGAGGTASDIAIMAKEIVLMRQRLNEIFARETGQPLERIQRDTERDYWMSAQQAKEYGLVGRIIENAGQIEG